MKRHEARNGFTLAEALVVVALSMVLLGLLLPAIHAGVEAGRAAYCKSKLAQLALASQCYHDTHSTLPAWNIFTDAQEPCFEFLESNLSIHAQLLPFLELSAAYDRINFGMYVGGDNMLFDRGYAANQSIANERVPAFLCPSDGGTPFPAGSNYRGCFGTGPHWHRISIFPDSANGVFGTDGPGHRYPLRLATVYDGLSRTAMWSERLMGSGGGGFDRTRDVFLQGSLEAYGVGGADDELRVCAAINRLSYDGRYQLAGKYWLFSGQHHTLYTHCLPPNSALADCLVFAFVVSMGAATARSHHGSTVNVAFADGHVSAVADAVSLAVWRALSSKDGNETVMDGSY